MSNIILLGDIAFNGIISTQAEKNFERFAQVLNILKEAEIVFANLEVPVLGGEVNEYKNRIIYSDREVTKSILSLLNVSCVSLANNHIYDCKMSGLKATINLLDELGIYHTGAGWKKEHIDPVIINNNGKKIGFLAYVDNSTNPKTNNFPELFINYLNPEQVIKKIIKLKLHVDRIICSIHWGDDYSNFFTGKQKKLAHQIIDAGADVIMGHHPHTIQTYEIYNSKRIFYSLGQLIFGDFIYEGKLRALKVKTKLGMIVRFNDNKLTNFNIIPTKENKGNRIIISNKHIENFLKCLRFINKLKNKYKLVDKIIRFKEAYIDRIYEFIFGYYRHPIKDLFIINNLKKFSFMFRDFKSR